MDYFAINITERQTLVNGETLKQQIIKNITSFLPMFCLLLGLSVQCVVLPYWIKSYNDIGGSYFIFFASSLISTLFFLVLYICSFKMNVKRVSIKDNILSYLFQGYSKFANGLFIIYTLNATRTQPLALMIIGSVGIIFSVPLTYFLTNKRFTWKNFVPIIPIISSILTVALMLTGEILYNEHDKIDGYKVMWIVMNLVGVFFMALYNVLQERYLLVRTYVIEIQKDKIIDNISTLFWTSLIQFIFVMLAWECDIIPKFGYSTIHSFLTNFSEAFTHSFTNNVGLLGISFIIGYIMVSASSIILNETSANFVTYVYSITIPLSIIIFITDFGTTITILWAVIPSIIIILFGIIIWKHWESRNKFILL